MVNFAEEPDVFTTAKLSKFSCGVEIEMVLSLLSVTDPPTLTLELEAMLTGPPLRFKVAVLTPELAKIKVPLPVGATDIVPPVVARVPANPAGAVITRLTSAAEFPESTLIADAPVAVSDGLVVVAAKFIL